MTTELLIERIKAWEYAFDDGGHSSPDEGMCVMEAVAFVAGEPFSDHPACACPVIASFMRAWNDGLPTDEDRRRLLSPFVLRLVGSKATPEVELRRSWMAFDWLVRECAAEFLSLTDALKPHADTLRALPEIGPANFDTVVPVVRAAGAAAWDAAGAAAGAAAWAAAGDAAVNAAVNAAWAAAGDAAGDAAGAAAVNAAWDAARDAAGAALKPSVERLQASAAGLVGRMLAAGAARGEREHERAFGD